MYVSNLITIFFFCQAGAAPFGKYVELLELLWCHFLISCNTLGTEHTIWGMVNPTPFLPRSNSNLTYWSAGLTPLKSPTYSCTVSHSPHLFIKNTSYSVTHCISPQTTWTWCFVSCHYTAVVDTVCTAQLCSKFHDINFWHFDNTFEVFF